MRILIIVSILTLSFLSIASASLDVGFSDTIAIYIFEPELTSKNVTEDLVLAENIGRLLSGATIVRSGIEGYCLRLHKKAKFVAEIHWLPDFEKGEFTFVTWVRIEKTKNYRNLVFTIFGRDMFNLPTTSIIVGIKSRGNVESLHADGITHQEVHLGGGQFKSPNIRDGHWHHIVFTYHLNHYALYVDANLVDFYYPIDDGIFEHIGFEGVNATLKIDDRAPNRQLKGRVFVDELAWFSTGLSFYDVQGLYDSNLFEFTNIMPVSPSGRLATTWADVKAQQ